MFNNPRVLAGSALALCVACSHGAPSLASRSEQAQRLKETGDVEGAAVAYAHLVCSTTDPQEVANYARLWADMWDASGRAANAEGELATCQTDPILQRYVASLRAGSMANWQKADALLVEAEGILALAEEVQPRPLRAPGGVSGAPGANTPPLQPPTLETVPAPSAAWRAEVALRRATVALHMGQVGTAFDSLARAQAAAPRRVDIYLVEAQARLSLRDYEGAVTALRPLLSLAPTELELDRARLIVGAAIEDSQPPMAPSDTAAIRDLLALLTQETLKDDDLKHALYLAKTREVPRMRTVAALIAFKSGEAEQGLALLNNAQEEAPLDPDPPRLIGLHYVADNMPDAALGPLVEASRRNPFDPEIVVAVAQLAATVGDWGLAHQSYTTLMVLQPDVPLFKQERDRAADHLAGIETESATNAAD